MTTTPKPVRRRPPRLMHGIYSNAVCLSDENPRDLRNVRQAMRRALAPESPMAGGRRGRNVNSAVWDTRQPAL